MKTKPPSRKLLKQIVEEKRLNDLEVDIEVNNAFNVPIDTIASMLEINRNEVWRMLKLEKIIGFFWGLYRENRLIDPAGIQKRK